MPAYKASLCLMYCIPPKMFECGYLSIFCLPVFQLTTSPAVNSIAAGITIEITCSFNVSGITDFSFQWTHYSDIARRFTASELVNGPNSLSPSVENLGQTLIIRRASRYDSGQYQCSASHPRFQPSFTSGRSILSVGKLVKSC